jgi:ABC-type transport system involved in multi-copper enzyme maturation permease subunit
MTWLVWRQYRWQAAIAALVVAVFAAVLIVTGLQMAAQWHTMLAAGTVSGTLSEGSGGLGSVLGHDFVILSLMAPALFGILVGAPLVASELESRSSEFAWAQSITRTRWLAVKVGWLLLAAAVWGGVISALVTWWSGPRNAAFANAFQANTFDMQGLVPVGYAVFATALGIAAGALLRRTLPAVGIVLAGFIGMRLWISQNVRMHFLAPVTAYLSPAANFNRLVGSVDVTGGLTGPNGQQLAQNFNRGAVFNGVPISSLPHACQALANSPGPSATNATNRCLSAAGYHAYFTYQPLSRYWAFQGIETGIYVAVAAALIAVTFYVIRHRDA